MPPNQDHERRILTLEHLVSDLATRAQKLEDAADARDRESYSDLRAQLTQAGATQQFWGRHVVTSLGTLLTGALLLYVGYLLKK